MTALLYVWFALTTLSLAILIWDLQTKTPTGAVMKLAWILVVAYTGPVGLTLFWLSCRQPRGVPHDDFIRNHWKQATGSLLHCVAGDATGIIIAAVMVAHFGLPNGIDLIIEYLAAFVVGLLVFQALFMIRMYQGDYWLAVRKTFFAETVSMNMVMFGMFPAMILLKHIIPASGSPYRAEFWLVMSLATIVGMATAYPINSWMVRRGLKHGMMSAKPKNDDRGAHASPHAGHNMSGAMEHEEIDAPTPTGHERMHGGHASHDAKKDHNQHDAHQAPSLPMPIMLGVAIGTFALLLLAVGLTSLTAPIQFTS